MPALSLFAAPCAAASLATGPRRASAAQSLRLRPANALRLAPGRAPASRRGGVAVQAVALPPLLPLAARTVAAFFVFYSSMNWVRGWISHKGAVVLGRRCCCLAGASAGALAADLPRCFPPLLLAA